MPGPLENGLQKEVQAQQTQNLQEVQQPLTEVRDEEMERIREENQRRLEAEKRRETRIGQMRKRCQVRMPEVVLGQETVTVEGERFARKHKESISAGKRKSRQNWKHSALYQRRINAENVEANAASWRESRERVNAQNEQMFSACSKLDAQAFVQYMTEEAQQNQELKTSLAAHDYLASGRQCVRRYMELPIDLDLQSDRSFSEQSGRMEEISGKTRALKHLLQRWPEIMEEMTEDEKTDLEAKLQVGEQLSGYYELRKKVVTNAYYRSHYNSEISWRYHESDTLEQKNLTVLLWQMERLRSGEAMTRSMALIEQLRDYAETTGNKEEQRDTRNVREALRGEDAEFGKNRWEIEDSRHAAYFRQFLPSETAGGETPPVYRRLVEENHYQVTGMREAMSESFVRNIADLPRFRAVQHADPGFIRSMIENLAVRPADAKNAEEIQDCQQRNLEGMRQFKELLKKQMNYLKRKYGNGLPLISAEDLAAHGAEFANDFTNMQGLNAFVEYLKALPGMFDPEDESDQEMERLLVYYDRCTMREPLERRSLLAGILGSATFSDYKRRVAVGIFHEPKEMGKVIEASDCMHLDIRWGVAFDETDVKGAELPAALSQQDMREQIKERAGEAGIGGGPEWNQMFPETEAMSREEAVRYFVEKETKERLEGKSIRELFEAAGESMGGVSAEVVDADVAVYEESERRRAEFMKSWKEDHPDEAALELPLTGTERSMRATLAMYRLYAHYETALNIRRQAIHEAEKSDNQADPVLRSMYEHLERDLLSAAEHYSRERGKVRL